MCDVRVAGKRVARSDKSNTAKEGLRLYIHQPQPAGCLVWGASVVSQMIQGDEPVSNDGTSVLCEGVKESHVLLLLSLYTDIFPFASLLRFNLLLLYDHLS